MILNKARTSLVCAPSGQSLCSLPSSVSEVCDCAFAGIDEIEIVILESVETLGDDVFSYCSHLEAVAIPFANLTGATVFFECHLLTDVEIGLEKSIPADSFFGCKSLRNITTHSKIDIIEFGAFEGCKSLVFELPNVDARIEPRAFEGCAGIRTRDAGYWSKSILLEAARDCHTQVEFY